MAKGVLSNIDEKLPTMQELCTSVALYDDHPLTNRHTNELFELVTQEARIDCFCVECKQTSVFTSGLVDIHVASYDFAIYDSMFSRTFWCARNTDHEIVFHFRVKDKVLQKIGQSPSLMDLSEVGLRKYKAVLRNEQYREFVRAVGLVSHGVGIGSFVYLRRIFEGLVSEAAALAAAAQGTGWKADEFLKMRMEDKILTLKQYLPDFLVTQRKLYGVLSVGVHTLDEDDCLKAFPVVRVGIELILDQKIAAKEKAEKEKAVGAELTRLHERFKAPEGEPPKAGEVAS